MITGNESLIKYLEESKVKNKPHIIAIPRSKRQQLVDKHVAESTDKSHSGAYGQEIT